MKIELGKDLEKASLPALAVFTFEEDAGKSGTASSLPAATQKKLAGLKSAGELSGREFECMLLHSPDGLDCERLLVIGAGKKKNFSGLLHRRVAGAAARFLRAKSMHEMGWVLEGDSTAHAAFSPQWAAEGVVLADFDGETYRTAKEKNLSLDRVVMFTTGSQKHQEVRQAVERGRIIGEAQNWARELVNEPSNSLTPTILAEKAEGMANRHGLKAEVVGPKQIQTLKMGAFWSVAQGSPEVPARLIVLRYEPADAPASPLIGLVGKGVTFDTGGISIKPSDSMHEMKTDMAGAATMLAVMQVIAQLKPRVKVIAVVPATDNMPSGTAQKPGDVQTSLSGKTIEILNTDAEGRLLLADALTYANQLGCTHLVDAATLTGAVMVALGGIYTGVFGWNQEWVDRVLASARHAGEKFWHMPVDEEYRPQYRSAIADFANTGGRYGGAITAAMFVGEFVDKTPWVHLDIAGTRWLNEEKPYMAKGATGVGVATLTRLLTDIAK